MQRHLVLFVAIALALADAGCKQSLFDSKVSDSPGHDAAPGDADVPPVGVDGGMARDCPAPCQGDPVADFDLTQGGANGRWSYLAATRDSTAAVFDEMVSGMVDGSPAWTANGGSSAAILSCADNPGSAHCQGVGDAVVFIPGTMAAGPDPSLGFRAQANGTYAISGEFVSPTGATVGSQQSFLVSRNSHHDLIHQQRFISSTDAAAFQAEVEALEGDLIHLTLLPDASDSGSAVALNFYVSLAKESLFPGHCQFAARFDDRAGIGPFKDECGNATLENLYDGSGPTPAELSVEGDSLTAQYGKARVITEGEYLKSAGAAMNYSGDFTVQFWAKLDEPQPSFGTVPYADWTDRPVPGGVSFFYDDTEPFTDSCYQYKDGMDVDQLDCIRGDVARDGGWHFYRLVRTIGDGAIVFCMDGAAIASGTVQFNMTGDIPPHLGRNVTYNPAYYGGSLDDVRVFKRALPCPTIP